MSGIDPIWLAKQYDDLKKNYAFKLLMKKLGSSKSKAYKELLYGNDDETLYARATVKVCDEIMSYIAREIEFGIKEANRANRDK
jgi:hypothetical protein